MKHIKGYEVQPQNYKRKRDPAIELMRIVGCLCVIACHINPGPLKHGVAYNSQIFITCLVADGVAIFWFITGCFLFREDFNYQRSLSHFAKKIGIPVCVFCLFIFFFYDFFISGTPILKSLSHPLSDYKALVYSLAKLLVPVKRSGHLWFLIAYFLLLLISPALNSFALYLRKSDKRENVFLALSFIGLTINTLTNNQTFAFSHHSLNAMIPGAIIVLWGDIFYRRWNNIKLRLASHQLLIALVALTGIVCVNNIRAIFQHHAYMQGLDHTVAIFWYSPFGLLVTICIYILCTSLIQKDTHPKLEFIICTVASLTFPIYVIHEFIIDMLNSYGIIPFIKSHLLHGMSGFWTLSFILCTATIIFLVSLAICGVLSKLSGILTTKTKHSRFFSQPHQQV